jgi:hypothetical protein
MLLWLSLICMIPFDLQKIDSERTGDNRLVERILTIAQTYLVSVGKEYDGACALALRLLTRKDVVEEKLMPFIQWQVDQIMAKDAEIFQVNLF